MIITQNAVLTADLAAYRPVGFLICRCGAQGIIAGMPAVRETNWEAATGEILKFGMIPITSVFTILDFSFNFPNGWHFLAINRVLHTFT